MKTIFRGAWFEAVSIQNLLKEQEIEVFVDDELMANIWGGATPVILKVKERDFDRTMEVLEAL